MGDQETSTETSDKSAVTSNTSTTATQVQTCVDVISSEDHTLTCKPKSESIEELLAATKIDEIPSLCATFESDVIYDGTVLSSGQNFAQTWYMKNTGKTSWPIGVTVEFVGGTSMFDQSKKSSNASFTQSETEPGEVVAFSVDLISPSTPNKNYTSYWRLTGPSGERFGDNMWCSIMVKSPEAVHQHEELINNEHSYDEEKDLHEENNTENEDVKSEASVLKSTKRESVNEVKEDSETFSENLITSKSSSEMVFPKLLVESLVESLDQLPSSIRHSMEKSIPASPSGSSHKTFALSEDGDIEEEVEISSLDGFLTDEEYDVLDASDEEFERVA
jgi:next-to-BRCA1 protein 1